jgi:predicted NBD/HSP70 family sugar kinase
MERSRQTDCFFLGTLLENGASSRAEVARITGLSKPTTSASAKRLLAAGVIVDCGQQASARGRPINLYAANPEFGHAVGVSLERGHVAVRALDFAGTVVGDQRIDTAADDDVPAALNRAREALGDISAGLGTPRLATAVAVAAPIDPRTATTTNWPGSPFTNVVTEYGSALGIPDGEPVIVDNDVNWATLAEHQVGSMRGSDDFLYLYLGAGIGAGLFLGGRLHRGLRGMAGEIAFVRFENGEALIHRLAKSAIGTYDGWGGSIDTARARAMFNDPTFEELLRPIVEDLSWAISNIAAMIDPDHIVLGGPLSEARPLVDALSRGVRPIALDGLTVAASSIGRDAAVVGAAAGALERGRAITSS